MDKFTKARIIGARALLLARGATYKLKTIPNFPDVVNMAYEEFKRSKIPLEVMK
jgi:DNA-directed RNA polymerase subunit K/omega